MTSEPPAASQGSYGLRYRCLSPWEVLAQSVANIAPTACAAAFIPAAFGQAGNATGLAFIIATIGLVLVALNINHFARTSASPGSLYSYISMGMGPTLGVLAGWGLLAAYFGTAVALTGAVANFTVSVFHLPTDKFPWLFYVAAGAGILLPWYVAFRDIRLSAKAMLGVEIASVGLIFILAIIIFAKFGFSIYKPQFDLHRSDFKPANFGLGLVTAIFCYVGFESATALGEEAKNPLKSIPRAVVLSAVIVGSFYAIMSFAEIGGFSQYKGQTLDQSLDPYPVLSQVIHMGFLAPILDVCALISGLGCVLACFNAGSRVFFAMGRHGIFHASVGGTHKTNETPHVAVTVAAIISLGATFIMLSRHFSTNDILVLACTFATFGFLLVYLLISIAAPIHLSRLGRSSLLSIVISILSVLFLCIPVVGSFSPSPDDPNIQRLRLIPYIFVGYLAVAIAWMIIQRMLSSGSIEKIEKDLEEIGARYGEAKGIVAEAQGQSMGPIE